MDSELAMFLETASLAYPHPVAVACGRILRARTVHEDLDATVRAGETLTRYLAAAALASFGARSDPTLTEPSLADFDGPLSWGHFLNVVQKIADQPEDSHPLVAHLAPGFRAKENSETPADTSLRQLLGIRNHYGHDLLSLTKATVEVILRNHSPHALLGDALKSLEGVLGLPLFLIEDQQLWQGRVLARRLLLMGESDNPRPAEIELSSGLDEKNMLYLGTPSGALNLWPWLTWDLAEKRVTYAVFVIHKIDKVIAYKSMFGDDIDRNSELVGVVMQRRASVYSTVEDVKLADNRSLIAEWGQERRALERLAAQKGMAVPWAKLDQRTIAWYSNRLNVSEEVLPPEQMIQTVLLDGRDMLLPDEFRQIVLLLGTDREVSLVLRRELLDCRAKGATDNRWDDRLPVNRNIVESLRLAVEFFGRHVGVDGATLDGLEAISGSADYVAMREALVNLFIHQDYTDTRTVAQIEIRPEQAIFFNAGRSLVNDEGLIDGGRSQARNPLIARALRLIGFAELAGSGLRALQAEWRKAGRRPPRFESNRSANTFTLTLDWRQVPIVVDSLWRERLGVNVSLQQAKILALLVDPVGFGDLEIASGTGILLEDVKSDLSYLKLQELIEETKARYFLRPDLRVLLENAEGKTP